MGIFSGLFGSSKHDNPYKAAAPYMDKVPGAVGQYYDPYIQMGDTGRGQMGNLEGYYQGLLGGEGDSLGQGLAAQYQQMAYDPAGYQRHLGEGFQEDPGYQWNLDQQLQGQNQAMAAGGMLGSPQHEQLAQQLASHLADQQYQNYLHQQFGIAGAGLEGMDKGLSGLQGLANQNLQYGYGASNQAGQNMQDYYYNRANLAGGQAQDARNRHQGLLGGLLGFGANAYGSYQDDQASGGNRGILGALSSGLLGGL